MGDAPGGPIGKEGSLGGGRGGDAFSVRGDVTI